MAQALHEAHPTAALRITQHMFRRVPACQLIWQPVQFKFDTDSTRHEAVALAPCIVRLHLPLPSPVNVGLRFKLKRTP